jgi:hypothetical protein
MLFNIYVTGQDTCNNAVNTIVGQSSGAVLPSGPTSKFTPQVRALGVIVQNALRKVLKEAKLTTSGPSRSDTDDIEQRKSSRRQSNILENLSQQLVSDLDFATYQKDVLIRLRYIFALQWNEELFNAMHNPKFSRKVFLQLFSRELYNKLQNQANAAGLDVFNDDIINNSITEC